MKSRLSIIPILNDFLYDVLYAATSEEKSALPRAIKAKVRTHTKAKMFANKSCLEEKLAVLSALGCGFSLTVFDTKRNKKKAIGQIVEKYAGLQGSKLVSELSGDGVYVVCDRQFAYSQGLMADASNSIVYAQNLLLNKAGYHLHGWKKKIKAGETEVAKEHYKISNYLAETLLNTIVNSEYIETISDVNKNDFKILSYLYMKQGRYVQYEELVHRFSGNLSLNKVTGCCRRLLNGYMIQKPPKPGPGEYQITAAGIRAVSNFWKQILKANEIE